MYLQEPPKKKSKQVENKQGTVLLLVYSKKQSESKNNPEGIVDKCSDLTCTKTYALTGGPKRGGGGVNVGHSLSPPSHFMLATGLKRHSFW